MQNKAEARPAWLQLAAGAAAGALLSLATTLSRVNECSSYQNSYFNQSQISLSQKQTNPHNSSSNEGIYAGARDFK